MKEKNILIPDIKCMASEIGKIVANICLDNNISLTTLKLEKLLILMQVEYIREKSKIFFNDTIVVSNQCNVFIKEVDNDFLSYAVGMDAIPSNVRFCEFISLLEEQNKIVYSILNKYGSLDICELENLPDIQLMYKLSSEFNTKNIQPALIFYGLGRFLNFEEGKSNISKLLKRVI